MALASAVRGGMVRAEDWTPLREALSGYDLQLARQFADAHAGRGPGAAARGRRWSGCRASTAMAKLSLKTRLLLWGTGMAAAVVIADIVFGVVHWLSR